MNIALFGTVFNGLEFVTYLLIPAAIFLIILVYIYFNITIIIVTLKLDDTRLLELDNVEMNFKVYAQNLGKMATLDVGALGKNLAQATVKKVGTAAKGLQSQKIVKQEEASVNEEALLSKTKSLSLKKKVS